MIGSVTSSSDRTPDLADIRVQLDALDRQLVQILAERSRLVSQVIEYKRARSMKVVDRQREDDMLAHIEIVAQEAGLDPRIARSVLSAIIDAFTILEVEQLGPDS
jgi:chorismate mutase